MFKKIKNFFFIGYEYKKEVKEKDLINKSLETLIMLKDNEHDYFSVNIPIVVSWLWIIISVYTTISSRMHSWTYNKSRSWAYTIISIAFIVRLIRFCYVADKNNTIINNNIKIYNEEIFKRLEKKEKSEKEYKNEVLNCLKDIKNNIKK